MWWKQNNHSPRDSKEGMKEYIIIAITHCHRHLHNYVYNELIMLRLRSLCSWIGLFCLSCCVWPKKCQNCCFLLCVGQCVTVCVFVLVSVCMCRRKTWALLKWCIPQWWGSTCEEKQPIISPQTGNVSHYYWPLLRGVLLSTNTTLIAYHSWVMKPLASLLLPIRLSFTHHTSVVLKMYWISELRDFQIWVCLCVLSKCRC